MLYNDTIKALLVTTLSILLIGGSLTAQPDSAPNSTTELTTKEREWIAAHPKLKVGNELDWPPFDFAENTIPKGYTIELLDLVSEKTGLELEYINGYAWSELLNKFKLGELDILPAIYASESRREFAEFTSGYYAQPSVIVVNKDRNDINKITDLKGKKVAVISDYVISQKLSELHPEIIQVQVDSLLNGVMAVSVGKVDAYIEGIGALSYVISKNYIPNVKFIDDTGLVGLENPSLQMAVHKGEETLKSILEKGMKSVTPEETQALRDRWLKVSDTLLQQSQAEEEPLIIWPILVVIALFILLLLALYGLTQFERLRIGTKILVVTVSIAIVVILISGIVSDFSTREATRKEAFSKLTAVREMKAQQIEDYFQYIRNQVITFSDDRMIIEAMKAFSQSFESHEMEAMNDNKKIGSFDTTLKDYYREEFLSKLSENMELTPQLDDYWPEQRHARQLQYQYIANNPNETGQKHLLDAAKDYTSYAAAHRLYHPSIRAYLEKFGYYDIFLVDTETGHIVYSVFKEVDYATTLLTGPYSKTNFASVFKNASASINKNFISIVDFEPYPPSYNDQASFIASPIFDDGKKIGVLIFQMPVNRINDIMTNKHEWENVGLGKSGETYIVGKDLKLRNQSRFLIEDRENYFKMIQKINMPSDVINRIRNLNNSIGLQKVDTLGTQAALSGESGTKIFPDYRGVSVLSSYRPLKLEGLNWVVMSEIDEAEAFEVFDALRDRIIVAGSILLAITIYLSYFLSKSLTRPLRFLSDASEALTSGKLDLAIQRSSGDEIGDLAENFEQMRLKLRETFSEIEHKKEELEERVKERTAELDATLSQQEEQNKTLGQKNTELQTIQEELIKSREKTEAT